MALPRLGSEPIESPTGHTATHRRRLLLTSAVVSMATTTFCFVVLLAFCFLASMAVIVGYYGPVELDAGAGCSRLVKVSSFLVRDITVRTGKEEENNGVVLYGLAGAPPRLDAPAAWSESHRVVVPPNCHKGWVYFLNTGSQIEVNYSVKPETELIGPLIAQGKQSLAQCTEEKPSVDTITESWPLVNGSGGTIQKTVDVSTEYHITVHNRNDHDMTVMLDFRIRAVLYDTTGADYACSPGGNSVCKYRLPILGQNAAVLSSRFKQRLSPDEEQHVTVTLSYEPRWIVYVVGSAVLSISLLLLYEILSILFGTCNTGVSRPGGGAAEQRASLTTRGKEEEAASLGSSYDSVSGDDDDDDDVEAAAAAGEGEGRRLCVVCCDARRDCFFLPCGHSATCHACGTRILEGDDGSCPLCRRKLKKVRRIFTV